MSRIPDAPSAALQRPPAGTGGRFHRRYRRGGAVTLLLDLLLDWQELARQRHALRSLDDRMLSDIGLSRADVEKECTKSFWRV